MLSGEELTTLPLEEVSSVGAVKRCLQERHGLPPRFRQRLFVQGSKENLDDSCEIGSTQHLELVVLSFLGDDMNLNIGGSDYPEHENSY